jgi:hypothetical protein
MRTLMLVLAIGLGGACGTDADPTPTGTVCATPDPMTFTYSPETTGCTGSAEQCNFGKTFMDRYCISCHDSALARSERNGAPLYHDFDTLIGVVQVIGHIDEEAGFGPNAENTFMPPERCPSTPGGSLSIDCPQPTAAERTQLAEWLACEDKRVH